jgi:hypothetical protein
VKLTDLDMTPGSRHLNRAWVCYCCHFWKEVGLGIAEEEEKKENKNEIRTFV